MTLKEYLQERYTPSTADRYYRDILIYLDKLPQEKAMNAGYKDVLNYLDLLRKKYDNPETIKCNLQAIKKYYYWLILSGHRKDHPCRYLLLRDKVSRDVQLQDLFTPEELELLMERKERFIKVKVKNQVIVSLLIYQGLTRNDIVRLTLNDVDLEEGTIYIKADSKTNSRTLKLKPKQIMLMYKYIHEARPKLLTSAKGKRHAMSDELILTKDGTPERGEGIGYLLEQMRHLFTPKGAHGPERKLNAKTVRMSVIANLLKAGHDLRLVQVFAGHKYPSSTERYRQTGIEELKAEIEKYHPLKD